MGAHDESARRAGHTFGRRPDGGSERTAGGAEHPAGGAEHTVGGAERAAGHGGAPGRGDRGLRTAPVSERDGLRLGDELARLEGTPYGRYKSLAGRWSFDGWRLEFEKVQADPYAPPSRIAVTMDADLAGIPADLWETPARKRATCDFLGRTAARILQVKHSPFRVAAGGQQVLERSTVAIRDGRVRLRIGIELPGRGRRIAGLQAERALCELLPDAVHALRWPELNQDALRRHADAVEDSTALRDMLPELGLVAFVADGSVLPRRSGVSDRPLTDGAVPFTTPETLRFTVRLPHAGSVTGMGVPEGVTLIVGGGFHGKSTLLHALERGVYDHVPGDGRELVVTRADAVKIRAEEGRRVQRTDVSAFIGELPTGADTRDFSTENASGSTSQAASIVEAMEAGAGALLLDEDTTATNLMIRDARMQTLVSPGREPLTPFADLVRPLRDRHGLSTVLVMGGSGDYFDVADHVIMMDAYLAYDASKDAHELARPRDFADFPPPNRRVPDPYSISATDDRGRTRVKRRAHDVLTFGVTDLQLGALEQLVDGDQVVGIGLALARLVDSGDIDGSRPLGEALDLLEAELDAEGTSALGPRHPADYARPRRHEIAAALNRLRTLHVIRHLPGLA
ncbi:MAG: ATPase [Streptosporangiales bacterium]|nr:ATPase [Streptosporangiales bacterium]